MLYSIENIEDLGMKISMTASKLRESSERIDKEFPDCSGIVDQDDYEREEGLFKETLWELYEEEQPKSLQNQSDLYLVQKILDGNRNAAEVLFSRYHRKVFRAIHAELGNPHDAEDITQNVFLKVLENLSSFRGESLFSTWLNRIAINEILQFRRKTRKTVPLDDTTELELRNILPFLIGEETLPDEETEKSEMQSRLRQAMRLLPPNSIDIISARIFQGLSSEEAAYSLDLPSPGAARTRLCRALKLLKKFMIDLNKYEMTRSSATADA